MLSVGKFKRGFWAMAFVTGDVIANDDNDWPFRVVFKKGDTIIAEWLVLSREDGEEQIVDNIAGLVDEPEITA